MGKMKEHPRYNVLSVRLSDEEKSQVETIVQVSQRPMSDLMRAVIGLMARMVNPEVPCGRVAGVGAVDGTTAEGIGGADTERDGD